MNGIPDNRWSTNKVTKLRRVFHQLEVYESGGAYVNPNGEVLSLKKIRDILISKTTVQVEHRLGVPLFGKKYCNRSWY